ncbi:MAG TPA: branched-chain amino acid ABC transporter substrate-binding protein [Anaerolineales bacterium]|nr:branched-chain amino acid ABC transporter substrate-binding protein [Anaerolineales bacterium]HLO29826.1 branched-chain amino acid ABC transporter substrate-binding protein [Anaerolineales bacterium]
MARRSLVVVSLLVIASVVLTACGGGGGGGSAKVIKIATQSPLSGDMSVVGVDIKRGAELGVEQMGTALTNMGFKIELAPFDDQGNPDTGVANAKQIVSDPAVLCGVGHYNSGVFIPSSEVYHTAGLAFVSPANTNPKVTTRGYLEVNRIVGRDDVQGVVGADFAAAQGMKSAFVVHDKTAYGQGIAEFFKQEAEKKNIQVLGFEGTEEKANFDALLTPMLAANPDVVYFGGMYGQAAVLFKQAREKGYMGMFLSDDGFDSSDAAKIGGQALLDGAGTFYSTVSGPAAVYPGTAKFVTDFKTKYGSDPQPFAAQAYDSAGICLKAIEAAAKAKNGELPTRVEVANAIRALKDYAGITGTITFNSIGDPIVAKYFVIQVGSADPTKWPENPINQTLDIAPPAPED